MKTTKTAIYAGGCFWGVEHYMRKAAGVIDVISGYTGGEVENPTYEEVKSHSTGHAEAVKIEYDPLLTDYQTLTRLFLEIHDPTQQDGQGVDIGPQYRSEIYYSDESEKQIAEFLIGVLKEKGYNVVTKISPVCRFWNAEEYHQNYCAKHHIEPECHFRVKRF